MVYKYAENKPNLKCNKNVEEKSAASMWSIGTVDVDIGAR